MRGGAQGVYLGEPLPNLVLSPLPVESSGIQRMRLIIGEVETRER